jgi:hypothetical protein
VKNQEVSCHDHWRTDQSLTHKKKITEVDMMRQKKATKVNIESEKHMGSMKK